MEKEKKDDPGENEGGLKKGRKRNRKRRTVRSGCQSRSNLSWRCIGLAMTPVCYDLAESKVSGSLHRMCVCAHAESP